MATTNTAAVATPAPTPVMVPQFDDSLKYIEVRDLERTNIRYQQGDNLFDKSKKYAGKAPYAINIPLKRKQAVVEKTEKVVTIRDRGPRTNGSSTRKQLTVAQLKEQVKQSAKTKAQTAAQALLNKNRNENKRAEAAEVNGQ